MIEMVMPQTTKRARKAKDSEADSDANTKPTRNSIAATRS